MIEDLVMGENLSVHQFIRSNMISRTEGQTGEHAWKRLYAHSSTASVPVLQL